MGPSPYLQMGRIDVPAAIEEEFNDWYNWVYIPTYLTVPGVIRARRFVAVDGQPKYLTVYEFERADVPDGEAWQPCAGIEPLEPADPAADAPRPRLTRRVSADPARSRALTAGASRPASLPKAEGLPPVAQGRLERARRGGELDPRALR